MISDIELSELIAVKMCHDMSGPIGAISNGTELLKEANDNIYEQSLELVDGSAKDSVAKILFFRQVYGTKNSNGQMMVEKLADITAGYYNSSKVEVKFSGDNQPSTLDAHLGKIILNLIMMIEKTLLYGGSIEVITEMKNDKNIVNIKAEGKSIKVNEEHLEILQNGDEQIKIDVKNVQAYLVKRFLDKIGMKIKVSVKEGLMEVKIH